jgi:putative two-component system response regulator
MATRNGLSCLVVDDEDRLRAVLLHLLAGEGFRCREASNGLEALRLMEAEASPLVISDLRMPQLDGEGLLRQLVARWPDTAVVMVSAVADVDMAVNCLHLGALDYVSKPFNLQEVRARVQRALERREMQLELKSYRRSLEERVRVQEQRIEHLFLGGVQALAQALEAKDAYLRGHSLRVAQYAVAIAQHLGMDAGTIDTISLGGRLHDIGKIGVSEEILNKPSGLTDAEYRHVMEHTTIGARILQPLLHDDPDIIGIVRSHHERLDGKGLPDGLKGDAIPSAARIVSVADAFDAMTHDRAYRPALAVERAFEELRTWRGVQWAPEAVDGFLEAFSDSASLPIPTPLPPPETLTPDARLTGPSVLP